MSMCSHLCALTCSGSGSRCALLSCLTAAAVDTELLSRPPPQCGPVGVDAEAPLRRRFVAAAWPSASLSASAAGALSGAPMRVLR